MIRRPFFSIVLVAAMISPASASDPTGLEAKLALDAAARPPEERGALPSNDTCIHSTSVKGLLPFSEVVNTAAATSDAPPGTCNASGATVMQNSVWYSLAVFTPCTVTVKATDLQNYDVIVAAFEGSCNNLVPVACADEPEPATLTIQAVPGTYYFKVGDWGSVAGGGVTQVSITTSLPNETCATATPITTPVSGVAAFLSYANPSPDVTPCGFPGSTQTWNDAWYSFTAPIECIVNSRIQPDTLKDTIFAIYKSSTGCAGTVIDTCGHSAFPQFRTTHLNAGETAYFRLAPYANGPGGHQVNLITEVRAINDECAGARELPCNTEIDADLNFGTNSVGDPAYPCVVNGPTFGVNSLWYRFTPSTPNVRLRTLKVGDDVDTLLAVYAGSCGNLTQIACNDDMGGTINPTLSLIELNGLSTSTQYYVRISAFNDTQIGQFRLMLECPPDCASCPSGAVAELETCGSNTNGGCSTSPPAYQPTAVGTTHCGTMYLRHQSGAISSDLDAYRLFAPATGTIKWTVRAQADYQALVLAPGCPTSILAFVDGTACADATVQTPVIAGQEVILAVRPSVIFGAPAFDCDSLSKYVAKSTFVPACTGDLNGDGQRNTADLVIFLGAFGTSGPNIPADLNNDGAVNTLDLTQFLGKFGVPCP